MFALLKALDPRVWLALVGAVFLAFTAGGTVGYFKGHSAASEVCTAAVEKARADALALDLQAERKAAASLRAEIAANAAATTQNQIVVEEIRNDAATPDCRVSPADVERLRRIKPRAREP